MRLPRRCLPEELAKRWVPGSGPAQIEPLSLGLVNRSYRVTRAGRRYSLRVADAAAGELGLDRRWECRVRTQAADAGLAPAVHHCDPEHGILVAEWATGRCWAPQETRLAHNMEAMASLLRRVHSLPILEPARHMNPAAWVALYGAALGRDEGSPAGGLRAAAADHLAALGPVAARVVCHSDLHRLNVLIDERPMLLDWEYAHVSEPLWDVAGWIANNDWPAALAERFLGLYLQRPLRAEDTDRLAHVLWLYDYVCVLWSRLYAAQRPDATAEGVLARAHELATRLARGHR